MNSKNIISMLSVALIASFGFAASVNAQPSYFGEACFLSDFGDGDTVVDRFGFTEMGDGHFILSGIELKDGSPVQEGAIKHGSAEIVGDRVIMIVNSIYNDTEETGMGTSYVNISLVTLDGIVAGIGTGYDKGADEIGQGHGSGTVQAIACPE